MDLNDLYDFACSGGKNEEQKLFREISARFTLIAQYRLGDIQAAEDIVQDTVMDIMKKYKDLNLSDRFTVWSQKVLKLNILNYLRNTGRRRDKIQQLAEEKNANDASEIEPSFQRKVRDCFKKVNHINSRHARILNFVYLGFSMDEICDKLDITRNNAYSILSRARSMLRLCLETGDIK